MDYRWTNRAIGLALIQSVAVALTGCAAPARFESPDPASRLTALGNAVEENDRAAIPRIITLLDSDDSAVRLFAILALQDMTGQTLGYDYAAPAQQRYEATDRWQAWYLAEGQSGRGGPGGPGGAGGAAEESGHGAEAGHGAQSVRP